MECDQLLRAHPDVIEAQRGRGVTNIGMVFFDTWTYGDAVAPSEFRNRRIGWSDSWVKAAPGANPYARLVSGFHCVVDLNAMELLRTEDEGPFAGGEPTPEVMGEYVPAHIPERILAASRREPLTPLHITQPEGPSFTVDGNLVRWQNWSLRVGFNHREGMTLHSVSYRDGDRERSIAHRMSFAEMIVPYRDLSPDHYRRYRRTAFDIGEWGLGFMTTSLELGCDCLGEIRYLNAVLHNSKGVSPTPSPTPSASTRKTTRCCGKHVDHDIGAEVRRMRRLTLSFHVTVANYEYLVYWRLYQDGNIECEVRATGIMVTTPLAPGAPNPNGTLVDERTSRRSISTSWSPVSTWTSTAPATPSLRRSPTPSRSVPRIHTVFRWWCGIRRCAPRARASRTSTSPPSVRGRSSMAGRGIRQSVGA